MRSQPEKKLVFVGLSGGVDSAVAAYLLKRQGYDVRGVFMKNFTERVAPGMACPWREDRLAAYQVASFLNIPIETWDFRAEYRRSVLDYLFCEYRAGRTPNPDVACNRFVKFDAFLSRAVGLGADFIAMGHYARLTRSRDGVCHLHKGADPAKDQSYFLSTLKQRQVSRVLFPLGGMKKTDVRALARSIGLPNANRPDSQGICFVGPVDMRTFLQRKIKPRRGAIVTTDGRRVGSHEGAWYYTIGQRRGIAIGGGVALYVADKDVRRNIIVVGAASDKRLATGQAKITQWHWISDSRKFPFQAAVKIRYRQPDVPATIMRSGNGTRVIFNKRQRAVASGQVLAVYQGSELVASGVIA